MLGGILRRPFAPKKSRPRKWPAVSMINRDFDAQDDEYGLDVGPIPLRLGSISATFIHGRWVTGTVIYSFSVQFHVPFLFPIRC